MEELKKEIMQKIHEMREKENAGQQLTATDSQVLLLAALLEESNHGENATN